jgi:Tetratricopeptide repeat
LEEGTRARVPLDWAKAQNNLGTALSTLGEREDGTARLEEVVAAYRAALEELTREAAPYWHDFTQEFRLRTHGVFAGAGASACRRLTFYRSESSSDVP